MNPYFNKINTIYKVLLGASIFVPMVFIGLSFTSKENDDYLVKLDKIVLYVIFFVCFVDLLLSILIYKLQINKVSENQSLIQKAKAYQSAKIVQAVLMVFATNLSSIFLFITNEKLFILIFPFAWFLFFKNKPSPEEMEIDFQLTPQEKNQIFSNDFEG